MLLILLSWLYIFFLLGSTGTMFGYFFNFKKLETVLVLLLGLFGVTISAAIFSFFYRLHFEFHLLLVCCNLIFYLNHRQKVKAFFQDVFISLNQLSISLKLLFTIVCFLMLAQCAAAPFVLDNESYYLQTIKWLNQFGLVPGLANLHFFLGQTSGWHFAQAALNLNFLFERFNDLSGFCLLLGNYYAIGRLHLFFQNKKRKEYLAAGFFLLGNLFFFQFIGAPSPDIPVVVISFILFFYILENWDSFTNQKFHFVTVLSLFILFIKPTAIALALLPAVLIFLKWKNGLKLMLPLTVGLIMASIFVIKNIIITGYPLFPTSLFDYFDLDWKLPLPLQDYYYSYTKAYGFLLTPEQLEQLSLPEKLLHWLQLPKLHGVFNKMIIFVMLLSFYFLKKMKNKNPLYFLYCLAIIQFTMLIATSPQYRFFLNFLVFFGCILLAVIFSKSKIVKPILVVAVILPAIPLFFPFSLKMFSNNEFSQMSSNFKVNQIITPHQNSRYQTAFRKLEDENLIYHHPENVDFFWATGNGPLPCANQTQINFFKSYFGYLPQFRSNQLKDGFFSKKLQE